MIYLILKLALPETGIWTITRSPGGETIIGTSTAATISQISPGTYTFTVTNESGCESPSTGNVVINNKPPVPSVPVVEAVIQTACGVEQGSVTLSGLPATGIWELKSSPENIILSGTGTEMTITGLAPGTHVFEVTNDAECTSVSSAEVVINEFPILPGIPLIDSIVHPTCEVSTGSIYLSNLPSAGNWTLTINPGSVDYSGTGSVYGFSDMVSGNYTFNVTNESGCTSGSSEEADIDTQSETPSNPEITEDEGILHSDATIGNQWYNENGLIQDAVSQNFTPTANGHYYVIVSNETCSSGASNIINFILTGIEQSELENSLELYPNPVSDELIIEIKDRTDKIDYEIFNATGRVVINGTIIGRTVVKTNDLVSGIYMIKIETEHSYIIKKIIRQ